MRLNRAPLVASLVIVVFALAFGALGLSSARFARYLALQPKVASASGHPPILAFDTCASCHTSPHKPPLTGACENCHVTSGWKSVSHQHRVAALDQGAHKGVACSRCHRQGAIPKSSACESCHSTYKHAKSTNCELCHNARAWDISHDLPKQHPTLTGTHAKASCPDCHSLHTRGTTWGCSTCHRSHTQAFILAGPHSKLSCVTCHSTRYGPDNLNRIATKAGDCVACHTVRHAGLTSCGSCHATAQFKPARFDHVAASWPLTGAHTKVACEKCHAGRQWASATGTSCVSCHRPQHAGLTSCGSCHTTSAFKPSTFDHASSKWPLTGAHTTLACTRCHASGKWAQATGTTCVACHSKQHGGLTTCGSCHTTARFKPSTFKHASVWRIDGAHTKLGCESCHAKRQFAVVKGTTCVACHGTKHGGETRCDVCHRTSAWVPIRSYTHPAAFPLTGQHVYVDCTACHKAVVFRGTPTRCVSCHADKSHGMPTCETCHTPDSWSKIKPHMNGGVSTTSRTGG